MRGLDLIRKDIDSVDEQIVSLLGRRADLAREVGRVKAGSKLRVYSPEREREIFARIRELSRTAQFDEGVAERIFRLLVGATRRLVGEMAVSFLGREGSVAHAALRAHLGSGCVEISSPSEDEVVARVESGEANFGVLQLQGSDGAGLDGAIVGRTIAALMTSDSVIVSLVLVPTATVLASEAATLGDVRTVIGEPATLERSLGWLQQNVPQAECKLLRSLPLGMEELRADPSTALLLRKVTAEEYALPILAHGVSGGVDSADCCVIFGFPSAIAGLPAGLPSGKGRSVTALVVRSEERVGALNQLLESFSSRGINLSKIESLGAMRATGKDSTMRQTFFIEYEEKDMAEKDEIKDGRQEIITELGKLGAEVKYLGSYHRPI